MSIGYAYFQSQYICYYSYNTRTSTDLILKKLLKIIQKDPFYNPNLQYSEAICTNHHGKHHVVSSSP